MGHSRKLYLMIGESGAGKSTIAKEAVAKNPDKNVRISRDDLREEFPDLHEAEIAKIQAARADKALKEDKNVYVDDTNLSENTRLKWQKFCNHKAEYAPYRVFTDMEECIRRDALREGKKHVGIAVIHRQFLMSKRIQFDDRPIVIFDLDGTLADSEGIRNVYDQSKVHLDRVVTVVRDWAVALSDTHQIVIASGRLSTCGDSSWGWMMDGGVPAKYLFMRHSFHKTEKDTVVKQGILDELLEVVPKEKIAFVVDDRPCVVNLWRENGLKVYPVAGTTDHTPECTHVMQKGERRCPVCYALADF